MKSKMENWDKVSKTNPRYTKNFSVGSYQGTSYPGQYAVMRLTELFGMCGKGWGYDIIEERIDDHGIEEKSILVDKDGNKSEGQRKLTHTIKLALWYKEDGDTERTVMPVQFGHTPYCYWVNSGRYMSVDIEAPKKSLTDALKKSAALLGIGADVFLGEYENADYIANLAERDRLENSDNKAEEEVKVRSEFKVSFDNDVKVLSTSKSLHEAKAIYVSLKRRIEARKGGIINTTAYLKSLDEVYAEAITKINTNENKKV